MRRRRTRRRTGLSRFKAGLLGIILLVAITYLGFSKFALPFAHQYTVKAAFPSANGIRQGAFVRIAGVNVGKVTDIAPAPGGNAATLSMTVDDAGLPLHSDATFAIRPRIFLEGNFFVDISPGTPSAPVVSDGHTFPVTQASDPVQLDQVLGVLKSDTRRNLQILLREFGSAIDSSASSYNRSIKYWVPAYKYTSVVSHDFLGYQPHDLSSFIDRGGTVSGAINAHPQNLQSLITDFNTTANAFARRSVALQSTVSELPRTLAAATPALNSLNAAFPPLRELARTLDPGVRKTGPAIDASLPFITQLRLLVRPQELRGLVSDLRVTVPALARLAQRTIPLMRGGVRPASSCIQNVVLPWTHLTVPDSNFNSSNGFPPRQTYIEAVDFLPGLSGESRDFDANGPYIRILGGGGTLTYSLQPGLFGQALSPISSAQPQLPATGTRPPLQETVPCETQAAITDLTAPSGGPMHAIDTNHPSSPGTAAFMRASTQAGIARLRALIKAQGSPPKAAAAPGRAGKPAPATAGKKR